MSSSFGGPFTVVNAREGAWRLTSDAPAGEFSKVQIQLRGVGAGAAQLFADTPRIERIALEWSRDVVIVSLTLADGGVTALTVHSAIVHEPQPALYGRLPLADFDAGARAFWKRVFRLMRLPGGRFLLGSMTRRARRRR